MHSELPANNVKILEEWSIIVVNNAGIPYKEFRKHSDIGSCSV
jgi:hypothetical protein